MKKGIVFVLLVVFVVLAWQGTTLYLRMNETFTSPQIEVKKYIQSHLQVSDLNFLNFYHGTNSYVIVEGNNEENEPIVIWVPNTLDSHVVKAWSEGISFSEVEKIAEEKLNLKQLRDIKLGIENGVPLYEITYIDDQDRYSYYYISFKDGTYLKNYHLNRRSQ